MQFSAPEPWTRTAMPCSAPQALDNTRRSRNSTTELYRNAPLVGSMCSQRLENSVSRAKPMSRKCSQTRLGPQLTSLSMWLSRLRVSLLLLVHLRVLVRPADLFQAPQNLRFQMLCLDLEHIVICAGEAMPTPSEILHTQSSELPQDRRSTARLPEACPGQSTTCSLHWDLDLMPALAQSSLPFVETQGIAWTRPCHISHDITVSRLWMPLQVNRLALALTHHRISIWPESKRLHVLHLVKQPRKAKKRCAPTPAVPNCGSMHRCVLRMVPACLSLDPPVFYTIDGCYCNSHKSL